MFLPKKVVDGAKTLLPSLKKFITLASNHFLFMMTKKHFSNDNNKTFVSELLSETTVRIYHS